MACCRAQDVVVRGGKALPLYDKVVQCGTTAAAVVLPAAEDGGKEGLAASQTLCDPTIRTHVCSIQVPLPTSCLTFDPPHRLHKFTP